MFSLINKCNVEYIFLNCRKFIVKVPHSCSHSFRIIVFQFCWIFLYDLKNIGVVLYYDRLVVDVVVVRLCNICFSWPIRLKFEFCDPRDRKKVGIYFGIIVLPISKQKASRCQKGRVLFFPTVISLINDCC